MKEWLSSPYFGIAICIAAFSVGVFFQKKLKSPLANPLAISIAIVILVLNVFHISFEDFNQGGKIITMLLAPATAVLGLSIYNQREILKKNFIPAVAGCLTGSVSAIVSIVLMCRAFGLDQKLTASLMPKSVTMPIAIGISELHGGLVSVTVVAVVITGVFGTMFMPLLVRLFRVGNSVAAGIAAGTSSHIGGTVAAIEMGEVEGAMSSIAIGIAGLITTFISLFF